jgi:hypothetical protein
LTSISKFELVAVDVSVNKDVANCAVKSGPGLCVDVEKVVNQIGIKVDFSIVPDTVDEVLEDVNITFCLGVAVVDNLIIRSTAIEVVVIEQL